MSAFHEFHEPIAVETPLGPGRAILVERTQHDYFWTVALDTCALVTFTQDRIRIGKSYTHRRGISDEQMKRIVAEPTEPSFEEMALRKRRAWDQAVKDCTDQYRPGEVNWRHC